MDRDEIGSNDAVAVEENAIDAARRQDRTIANLGSAKTQVLVPYVFDPPAKRRFPSLDQLRCRRPRTVVGDDDLEIPIRLASE